MGQLALPVTRRLDAESMASAGWNVFDKALLTPALHGLPHIQP